MTDLAKRTIQNLFYGEIAEAKKNANNYRYCVIYPTPTEQQVAKVFETEQKMLDVENGIFTKEIIKESIERINARIDYYNKSVNPNHFESVMFAQDTTEKYIKVLDELKEMV